MTESFEHHEPFGPAEHPTDRSDARNRIEEGRQTTSAEITLRSLSEAEFILFHGRLFRSTHRYFGNVDWFSKVAHLFTTDDEPSPEALRIVHQIGQERGLEFLEHLNTLDRR